MCRVGRSNSDASAKLAMTRSTQLKIPSVWRRNETSGEKGRGEENGMFVPIRQRGAAASLSRVPGRNETKAVPYVNGERRKN